MSSLWKEGCHISTEPQRTNLMEKREMKGKHRDSREKELKISALPDFQAR